MKIEEAKKMLDEKWESLSKMTDSEFLEQYRSVQITFTESLTKALDLCEDGISDFQNEHEIDYGAYTFPPAENAKFRIMWENQDFRKVVFLALIFAGKLYCAKTPKKHTISIKCRQCGNMFEFSPRTYDILGLRNIPSWCPRCKDLRGGNKTVVLLRDCIQSWHGVAVSGLPGVIEELDKGPDRVRQCWRLTLKGILLPGVRWEGRLDIYSFVPPANGTFDFLCDVRHMKVRKARTRDVEVYEHKTEGLLYSYFGEQKPAPEGKQDGDIITTEKEEVTYYLVFEPPTTSEYFKLGWHWEGVDHFKPLPGRVWSCKSYCEDGMISHQGEVNIF